MEGVWLIGVYVYMWPGVYTRFAYSPAAAGRDPEHVAALHHQALQRLFAHFVRGGGMYVCVV